MQRYQITGFVWGLFAFAVTGKWYAPLLINGIVAMVNYLFELIDNARSTKAGKPRPYKFPTFGAVATLFAGSLIALATWCGK